MVEGKAVAEREVVAKGAEEKAVAATAVAAATGLQTTATPRADCQC